MVVPRTPSHLSLVDFGEVPLFSSTNGEVGTRVLIRAYPFCQDYNIYRVESNQSATIPPEVLVVVYADQLEVGS